MISKILVATMVVMSLPDCFDPARFTQEQDRQHVRDKLQVEVAQHPTVKRSSIGKKLSALLAARADLAGVAYDGDCRATSAERQAARQALRATDRELYKLTADAVVMLNSKGRRAKP